MRKKHELHGGTSNGKWTRLYTIWRGIWNRCVNPKNRNYPDYGGRGIVLCDEWLNSFAMFRDWSYANGYDDSLSIDRIDSNGNYEPGNCQWATMKVQANNRRNHRLVEIDGVTKNVSEWSTELGIPLWRLNWRYYNGASAESFASTGRMPKKSKHMIEINGVSKNAREWAESSGVNMSTIYYRLSHGVTGIDLLGPSKNIPKKAK